MSGLDNLNNALLADNNIGDLVAPIPGNEQLDPSATENVIGASIDLRADSIEELQPFSIDEYLVDDNEIIPTRTSPNRYVDRPLLSTEDSFTVNERADADLLSNPARQPYQDSLSDAISLSSSLLDKFLNEESFSAELSTALGDGWDKREAIALISDLITQKALPEIKILPAATLQANGAFDGEKIYLSQELLDRGNTEKIAAVFLEEVGHYLDSKLNTADSKGDEGEIFSSLVRELVLDGDALAQLTQFDDRGVFNLDGREIAIEKSDNDSGVFLVGAEGELSFDLIADAGSYKGELAVFSLTGMENLTPGSTEFIFEAARRALSNSSSGYRIINDSAEGARFSGSLGEVEQNEGQHGGRHKVNFTPGDRIALMLVPNGTVQAIFDNPTAQGADRPLFSIASNNPGGKTHLGQLVEGTFVWEDLRFDGNSDADYNDVIVQIKGAVGVAPNIEQLMDSDREWRTTETGKQIIDFVSDISPPVVEIGLPLDTGLDSTDKITNNPTLTTHLSDPSYIDGIEISINDGETVNITDLLQVDNSLTIDRDKLTQLLGGELADGSYQINITATDDKDNSSTSTTTFTLDTTAPPTPSDITVDDNSNLTTDNSKPTIAGEAPLAAIVEINSPTSELVQAPVVEGTWEIAPVSELAPGENQLTATAIDTAGNRSFAAPLGINIVASPTQVTNPLATIRAEGTVTINGSSDFDGEPIPTNDDALIYAKKGFTINGNPTLPIQRDANGNPKLDSKSKYILVNNAVTVSDGYLYANASGGNRYGNLVPPQIVPAQTIDVPVYADLKTQELNKRIPTGTTTVTFNASANPINNASQWTSKFPSPGTATNPKVVKVTGGGLNVPNNVNLSNYVITVESGDFNFNGNAPSLDNVVLITNNGNINLGKAQANNVAAFANGSINMNGQAKFSGNSLIASGNSNSSINFNGATKTINATDELKVVSAGSIIFNGSTATRGNFQAVKDFTANGSSTIYGSIGVKGNIIFNGNTGVVGVGSPDTTPPVITAALKQDTARSNTTNTDKITFDPTIIGTLTDASNITTFKAGLDSIPVDNYVDILSQTNADGSFTLDRTTLEMIIGGTLVDGVHTLHLVSGDSYGNSSSFDYTFTLDTTEAAPTSLDLTPASDSGTSDSDNITSNNKPVITGIAAAFDVINLYNDGQLIAETIANDSGEWSITSSNLSDGVRHLTATAIDIAGNISPASIALPITIDTALPQLNLTTSVVSAPLTQDSRAIGTVSGTGSEVVEFSYQFDDLTSIPVLVDSDGNFDAAFDFTGVSNGSHILTFKCIDAAGNVSTNSFNVEVRPDFTPPVITAALKQDTARSNTTNTDKITFDPTIIGTLTDASTIATFKAGLDSIPVDNYVDILSQRNADGSFTLDRASLEMIIGGTLVDGVHTLHLVSGDSYGNSSSIDFSFTLDTTEAAPTNLDLTPASDSGTSDSDNITSNNKPVITGIAAAFDVINLYNDGQLIGTTTANDSGEWSITSSNLSDGVRHLTATAIDIAGNISPASIALPITIDTALPELSLTNPIDTAPLNLESRIAGVVSGTGSAIVEFSYQFDNLNKIPVSINSDGSFDSALDLTGISNGDRTLTFTTIDTAGNVKTNTFNVVVEVDRTPPVINANLKRDTARTNTTNTDKITSDPTIIGTVTDENTITVLKAGLDSTPINNYADILSKRNADGGFTLDRTILEQIIGGTLTDGEHTLHLIASDRYGNTSNFDYTFTLDTTAPPATLNLDPDSDLGEVGDRMTALDKVTLVGKSERDAVVNLQPSDKTINVDDTGNFSFSEVPLNAGDNSFSLTATDLAGNQQTTTLVVKRLSPPTNIVLSELAIAENSERETVIGTLTTTDPDEGETHTYSLVDDAGGRFQIVGNELRVAKGELLDFESDNSHTIKVRTTDSGNPNQFFEKTFAIIVTNVNDAPSFTSNPVFNAEQDAPYAYNIVTSDPDKNDTRTITATNLPAWLTLADNGDGTAKVSGTPGESDIGFYPVELTVTDAAGASTTQSFVISAIPTINLVEGDKFNAVKAFPISLPATPSILSFTIDPLVFDNRDLLSIKDAFEVALVDEKGRSLVHSFDEGKDAFFNWTEGETVATGAGTSYDEATKTVSLNLVEIAPNTKANLIFRLVNDDSDTTSHVTIKNILVNPAPADTTAPIQTSEKLSPQVANVAPDFNHITDVSPSITPEYHRTTFNPNSKLLTADVALRNGGTYSINDSLLVAVTRISDESVKLHAPDGLTPEGIPYYNFSNLVKDGKLSPEEVTEIGSLVFYNPQQVQFTYELEVLASVNGAPVIESSPIPAGASNAEVVAGKLYEYDVEATDPEKDALTYKLSIAPVGMAIDEKTGKITWNPDVANLGNHQISIEVSDSRGGVTLQDYTLSVVENPPNRPPNFTSTPVVDAYINTPYKYDADAVDPDGDDISYGLTIGPEGMEVDPSTGSVDWTPPPAIILGDTIFGRIATPGETDEFTFSGTKGQRIYFDPLQYTGASSSWSFDVYSPSGAKLFDGDFVYNRLITLTEDGNYRIVVDGSDSFVGNYGFSVIDTGLAPVAQFDTDLVGKLAPGSEDDLFRFTGSKGQKIYLDRLSKDGSMDWVLYNTNNQVVTNNSFDDLEIDLPASGEYLLALRGAAGFNNTVNYSFRIVAPDLLTTPMTLGSTVSGEITKKGEQDSYTFTGEAGQQLFYDAIGGNYFTVRVYDPNGVQIISHDSRGDRAPDNGLTLTMNGTYKVVVDGNGEDTGSYQFRFLNRSDAPLAELD
ncbi:MAG: Ig-like domain-containing protein, partial [Xenococcaceae cyanobacterium]